MKNLVIYLNESINSDFFESTAEEIRSLKTHVLEVDSNRFTNLLRMFNVVYHLVPVMTSNLKMIGQENTERLITQLRNLNY